MTLALVMLLFFGFAVGAILIAKRARYGLLDGWFRRRLLPDVAVNPSRIGPAREAFQIAAASLGLQHIARGMSFVVEGQHDGFFVHAEPLGLIIGEASGEADVRVTLDGESCVRHDLWLHSRKKQDTEDDLGRRKAVFTGDPEFDARYVISGPEALVRSLLGRRHRRSLLQLDGFLTVKDGRVIYTARCLSQGGPGVEAAIKSATALARSLSIEKDAVLDQLLDNAENDSTQDVRILNLSVALREHPGASELLELCRRLLEDPVPAVRLEAAIALGVEGLSACVSLARGANGISGPVRSRALRHIAAELPFEDSLPILAEALTDAERDVRVSAIKSMGKLLRPEIVGPLVAHLRVADREETLAIAAALGRAASIEAESALARLLDHELVAVQERAVISLGRIGSPASVPTLIAYRVQAPSDVRRSIDEAIAAIKLRAMAEPGRLSISLEPEEGALSVATAEVGSLSPPTE